MDKNEYGYYEIRLESIGGLGANLCGKMLGEIGLKNLGLNSAVFSSYGSEKTGTPVKGYIRFCDTGKEIYLHSPILHPHLLAIFHEALLSNPTTIEGCHKHTDVLINTTSEQAASNLLQQSGMDKPEWKSVYIVNAGQIAMDTKSRVNVVMLGAMARIMRFIPLEAVYEVCKKTLGKKYPTALSGNLEGIKRGYDEVKEISLGCDLKTNDVAAEKSRCTQAGLQWGYDTAPIGGINPYFGNSVVNDLSPSRQGYIPLFIKERCINCGLCDSTCPDMVFQFAKGEYKGREMMVNRGLDYYHCKGCMRCVEICPVNALVAGKEAEHQQKDYFLPNQSLLKSPAYYEKTGPDGYITSESYLTEKRLDGGEV